MGIIKFFVSIWVIFHFPFQGRANESDPAVKVENPFYYIKENGKTKIETESYLERRSKWAIRLDLGSSFYSPAEDFVDRSGVSFYGGLGVNRNFKSFSMGVEVGALSGKFDTTGANDVNVLMLNVGGILYLDGLFKTPYVVPFFGAGVSIVDVGEDIINDSETKEDFSPYFKGGVMMQLNWLDKLTALRGYYNYGLENTFLVFQFRNVSKTDSEPDLNFGSSLSFEVGLQLEF